MMNKRFPRVSGSAFLVSALACSFVAPQTAVCAAQKTRDADRAAYAHTPPGSAGKRARKGPRKTQPVENAAPPLDPGLFASLRNSFANKFHCSCGRTEDLGIMWYIRSVAGVHFRSTSNRVFEATIESMKCNAAQMWDKFLSDAARCAIMHPPSDQGTKWNISCNSSTPLKWIGQFPA